MRLHSNFTNSPPLPDFEIATNTCLEQDRWPSFALFAVAAASCRACGLRRPGRGKKGACHLFRHAMATTMIELGADVRILQEMLGHAKLDTTAIYTHVSITKLREVYLKTHPAAKLGRPIPTAAGGQAAGADAQELLTDLAEEAMDEVASSFDGAPASE